MKKIVFVLSSNYSGSHHFALMMGSHLSTAYLGETRRLKKSPKKACYICRDKPSCDLFAGIGPQNIASLYEQLYRRLPEGVVAVVDNSKKPGWAGQYLHLADQFDLRFVHLIRDPRALVRRWLAESPSASMGFRHRRKLAIAYPHRTWAAMSAPTWVVHAYRWLRQNQEISEFISKNRLAHRIVTYRDLALEPQQQLDNLMTWLGMEYQPGQLEYWKRDHHGTQKQDYFQSTEKSYFDLRWQADLDETVQTGVMEIAEIRRFLSKLGLYGLADGLTSDLPVG
ncbi:MAG: hypothetical protein VW985_03120 [Gammaproteobacteria bacterium]